jgi:hypothetical protein
MVDGAISVLSIAGTRFALVSGGYEPPEILLLHPAISLFYMFLINIQLSPEFSEDKTRKIQIEIHFKKCYFFITLAGVAQLVSSTALIKRRS